MNDNPNLDIVGRYNRQATGYQNHWAPVLRPMGARLVERLRDRSRELGQTVHQVLDLGTGTGSLLPVLEQSYPGATVIGVDRSPGMLSRVSGNHTRVAMDAEEIGFRDCCVDVAVLAFMLFHLGDPIRGLTEVRRTLRPGGIVGTLTWAGEFTSPAGLIWEEELDSHGAPPLEAPVPGTGHDRVDSPRKVEQLLSASGFQGIHASLERVEHTFTLESFLELRTSCGRNLPRFKALDPGAQEACLGQARKRLSALPSEGFLTRGNVVYAVANLEQGAPRDG